jgi:sRNA-binding carbon storage regulator CsrA
MQKRHVYLTLLLVASILLGQGCKTTVMGPEGQTVATYRLGKLSTEEPKDINAVYQATLEALTELELNIIQKMKDELTAKVIARDSQDTKITVTLLAITKDSTKVSIHAGSYTRASRVYQTIHKNLQQ